MKKFPSILEVECSMVACGCFYQLMNWLLVNQSITENNCEFQTRYDYLRLRPGTVARKLLGVIKSDVTSHARAISGIPISDLVVDIWQMDHAETQVQQCMQPFSIPTSVFHEVRSTDSRSHPKKQIAKIIPQ